MVLLERGLDAVGLDPDHAAALQCLRREADHISRTVALHQNSVLVRRQQPTFPARLNRRVGFPAGFRTVLETQRHALDYRRRLVVPFAQNFHRPRAQVQSLDMCQRTLLLCASHGRASLVPVLPDRNRGSALSSRPGLPWPTSGSRTGQSSEPSACRAVSCIIATHSLSCLVACCRTGCNRLQCGSPRSHGDR